MQKKNELDHFQLWERVLKSRWFVVFVEVAALSLPAATGRALESLGLNFGVPSSKKSATGGDVIVKIAEMGATGGLGLKAKTIKNALKAGGSKAKGMLDRLKPVLKGEQAILDKRTWNAIINRKPPVPKRRRLTYTPPAGKARPMGTTAPKRP